MRHLAGLRRQMSSPRARFASTAYLPDLHFDYGELEPFISGHVMRLHHLHHHQAYVSTLNYALDKYSDAESAGDITAMLALQPVIKFNAGGHTNHSIFWRNLAPANKGGGEPQGELGHAITATWGSTDQLRKEMTAQCAAFQGSGWGWLVYNTATRQLEVTTRPNQDPVSTVPNLVPLLGIDVWEHAYYLDYKNSRQAYLDAIWSVVNWPDVSARFQSAAGSQRFPIATQN
eukprot:c54554_g1_i1.p1 GENE.c54554_g1_i1~~c54554_g1_i1.p1  ORF type:complete len:231 (-),score=25.02 c54554_g1_i1:27-719(-)